MKASISPLLTGPLPHLKVCNHFSSGQIATVSVKSGSFMTSHLTPNSNNFPKKGLRGLIFGQFKNLLPFCFDFKPLFTAKELPLYRRKKSKKSLVRRICLRLFLELHDKGNGTTLTVCHILLKIQ